MLQRAASNAYSWWWASHIRTKQSKWMEQNLLDMDEKVHGALNLIQKDGDSFARRAEMYYKQRPELIIFIEESYKAYRALAERYDKLSTELQNANNTIASVFPEQVQFAMDEEDEEAMPKFTKKQPGVNKGNIPKVPKTPIDLKTVITMTTATNKMKPKRSAKVAALASAVIRSGLTKQEALKEIDTLQKQILTMQTEKEFSKSSYESQLARYWKIENQIKGMQDRVFNLQDEFGEGVVIEDDEARNLMATAALKSCQESLTQLQEKQDKTAKEARIESARIKEAIAKFESLKGKLHGDRSNEERSRVRTTHVRQKSVPDQLNQEINSSIEEKQRSAEQLRQEIKAQLEASSCLTITEMAEKIDELVNKVISLESALSSQTALVNQLRSETDTVETQIRTLEDEKAPTMDGKKNLQEKLKDMEEKLGDLQSLNRKVENEKSNFQTQVLEMHCNLDHLSDKLPNIQQDEDPEPRSSIRTVHPEQPDKLPGVTLGASEEHAELKQPDESFKAREGYDNPKQMRLDETCEVTNSRQNEEQVNEMKTSKLQSPKEEESQNFEGKSEKADASGMNRNQDNNGLIQEDPPNLGSIEGNSKKNDDYDSARNPEEVQTTANSQHLEGGREDAGVSATSRCRVEEGQIESKSQSSKGSDEKPDAGNNAKSKEGIILHLSDSVNSEGNSKENGNNGSAGNQGLVKTEANSQHSEGCVNSTLTSDIEEIHKQENPEHPSEQNKDEKKTCSEALGEKQEKIGNVVDEPNWEQLFLSGIEDREKILLTKYNTALRNFKDAKSKLNEMDEKNRDHHLRTSEQLNELNELKTANALKDEEIRSLHQKLNLMQKCFNESKESVDLNSASDNQKTLSTSEDQNVEPKITMSNSAQPETPTYQVDDEEMGFDLSKLLLQQPATISEIEERLRTKIDELLEENLDFWLKFSTSFHKTQKFETRIQDLKSEVTKLQEKGKKMDDSNNGKYSLKSEARPLYKHLREIQTELNVWSDKSSALRDELENRFSSLCNIQKEITAGLKASAEEDEFTFTSYQAAKFQGEVLNMKQENNKVGNELQAALDHIETLQLEVETNLTKLNEEFRLSGSTKQDNPQLRHSESRNRIPLRSFIFGVKPKKQKHSIFSMAPVMQKKYYAMKAGTL